jgi:hypothetical protein
MDVFIVMPILFGNENRKNVTGWLSVENLGVYIWNNPHIVVPVPVGAIYSNLKSLSISELLHFLNIIS